MARRHKLWARYARSQLLMALGNACNQCGDTRDLTFDCIVSTGHLHHSMDASARMCFYHRQHENQNVQILCRSCNGRKGHAERMKHQEILDSHPF